MAAAAAAAAEADLRRAADPAAHDPAAHGTALSDRVGIHVRSASYSGHDS